MLLFLEKEKKIYAGRVDDMLASFGFFELKTVQSEALLNYLESSTSFEKIKTENGLITAFLTEEVSAEVLNRTLFEKGIFLSHLVKRKASLEEQFLEITKN